MINIIEINGHKAVVSFDPGTSMFRGEFVALNGGADFYADNVAGLAREGQASLDTFMEVCRERGIDPIRKFSGRFQVRLNESLHARAVTAAAARGKSLNQFVVEAIEREAING
ncbi:MAG: type II toxin-antitoxin system HicB family antitoxin [Luteimonas sp.]